MNLQFRNILFCITSLVIFISPLSKAENADNSKSYPLIKSIDTTFTFDDAKKAFIELFIKGLDGEDLYCLKCDNYWHADSHPDDNFDFSGEFECYLKALYKYIPRTNLLSEAEHMTSDWDSSRARYFTAELLGECGDYPDYGRIRTFKLRGMDLIFIMKNIDFNVDTVSIQNSEIILDYTINSYDFQIIALSNPNNTTEITQTSSFVKPKAISFKYQNENSCDCSKVNLVRDK